VDTNDSLLIFVNAYHDNSMKKGPHFCRSLPADKTYLRQYCIPNLWNWFYMGSKFPRNIHQWSYSFTHFSYQSEVFCSARV